MLEVPARGYVFTGWSGSCSGTAATCTVTVASRTTVSATFTLQKALTVPVVLRDAAFKVAWKQSVGSGNLVIKGTIGKPSQVVVVVQRTGGTKAVITDRTALNPGSFSITVPIPAGPLDDGRPLLPGGFAVTLSGRSGSVPVPPQTAVISLLPPPEGVVSRAYASTSAKGAPAATVHGREVFAHFVFQSQPTTSAPIKVAWYWPNGKPAAVATEPNNPDVVSSIGSKGPLPAGAWRADLLAGSTVIKSLTVQVR
jgi:uncharacterized repeat protein (TIGR02543 family)